MSDRGERSLSRGRARDGDGRPILSALARRAWVPVVLALLGAGVASTQVERSRPTFEARAVVTPSSTPTGTDVGALLETLFATEAVVEPVVRQLDLDATASSLLSTDTLRTESPEGDVLVVVGTARSPERAIELANVAAQSFRSVAEGRVESRLAVLQARAATGVRGSSPTIVLGVGAVAGAFLGATVVLVLFALRQPVLSEAEVQRLLPAHVNLRAWAARSRGGRAAVAEGGVLRPRGVAPAVVRAASSQDGLPFRNCCVVVGSFSLSGPRRLLAWTRRDRTVRALLGSMGAVPFGADPATPTDRPEGSEAR